MVPSNLPRDDGRTVDGQLPDPWREVANLRAEVARLRADRDRLEAAALEQAELRGRAEEEARALMNLIVQPWTRCPDGRQLWKINLAWQDTSSDYASAVAAIRTAAGLDQPERT